MLGGVAHGNVSTPGAIQALRVAKSMQYRSCDSFVAAQCTVAEAAPAQSKSRRTVSVTQVLHCIGVVGDSQPHFARAAAECRSPLSGAMLSPRWQWRVVADALRATIQLHSIAPS
mmetsp:Transcript_2068/g.5951  ORF Transcript_2068/g.5951 Transcript_2068/m.5951 type:complete len:115 (-) Transcript_2068:466-810(-)